jgi:D-glycero-alpha-D-manno-heptose-7-phosphate kinase
VIITRTPFRISLFGSGTDCPEWYRQHGGSVLSVSINKYSYITCRLLPQFFDYKHRIVYSTIEIAKSVSEIKHPSVRAVFEYLKVQDGLEIHYDGDLPARSGIAATSSFTVGLLNTLMTLKGTIKSKFELAHMATEIEQNILKENLNSHDPVATSFGGFNRIDFEKDGTFSIAPLILPRSRELDLNSRLMMFFTGVTSINGRDPRFTKENFNKHAVQFERMKGMADEAQNVIQNGKKDLDDVGRLMNEAWQISSSLSVPGSDSRNREIVDVGRKAGALGGTALAAGDGGFILFYVNKEQQESVRQAMKPFVEVKFQFEHKGTHVLLAEPETTV